MTFDARDAAKDIAARDTAKKNIAAHASNLYDPWRFPLLRSKTLD
jgi:hypothetical protein